MNSFARPSRVLVLGLLLAMVLAACGQAGTGGATTPAADAPTTAAAAPTTAAAAPTTAAAQPAGGATIRVGSKDFTEEFIVAELYAQLLEDAGFTVEKKLNLGGTPIAHTAITNGEIDLYPEYTSTGLLTVLKKDPMKDPKQIYDTIKQEYEAQFKLTWLDPSPFNDAQGLGTSQAVSEQYGIKTYSDLATKAPELRLGGPAEFAEREDGIKGLQQAYGGFQFKEFQQLGTGSLRYDALKNGAIDVIMVATTDARIAADNVVVLQDDKSFFPIYNIAPVIRQDTLAANPQIAEILNKLAPLLTDSVMIGMNAEVDIDGKEPAAVAKAFLESQGLLTR